MAILRSRHVTSRFPLRARSTSIVVLEKLWFSQVSFPVNFRYSLSLTHVYFPRCPELAPSPPRELFPSLHLSLRSR